ncbi:glycine zipper 2TM domain-containing protein [Variovorax sp. J22R133]|uniref:glycine zipper 2TM domain-containing protein n=1 Tax=Variovorax brevis TaxID=3053503 RepID=UPI00257539E5|nr:glycine zipper 2TM domain-containing protein [Variovorax sp. J22R133]MDM0113388.1 glycine zipper 2TM domain-containing protein [Variovorax sp. J22R133]
MKNFSTRFISVAGSVLALATLTACVAPAPVYQTTNRYPYQAAPYPVAAQPAPNVVYGRVANIEVLQTTASGGPTSGGGAVAGGVVGGVLGHQVGSGRGNTAATILGAVGGAVLGNVIEANNRAPQVYQSYRVSIQTEQGGYRAFDVSNPGDLRVGDRVRIDNGQISRI